MNHSSSALEKNDITFTMSQESMIPAIKAHRIRWLILVMYIIYATINSFQWVQYSVISNIVMKYYHVRASEVEWTSMVFVVVWLVLVLPTSFIIDRKGIRVAALVGCFATAIGAVIKVFSLGQNLFYFVLIGQIVVAISQVFILSLPPKIAVTWFQTNEVSTACSLGYFGMQLGRALGLLVPPFIVKDREKIEDIGSGLYKLSSSVAAAILPVTFIVFLYYPKRPSHAPSQAQLEERISKEMVTVSVFFRSLKTLIQNRPFIIHAMAYGISLGIFFATGILLHQFTLSYFTGAEEFAHRLELVMVTIGLVAPFLIGPVLDITHNYKKTAFMLYATGTLSMGGLWLALEYELKWMAYLVVGIFGFSLNAYMTAGIEFAMEITFPSPESTTAGILLAISQILGLVFTFCLRELNSKFGTVWAIAMQLVMLLTGCLLTYWTRNNLGRHEVFRKNFLFQKVSLVE